MMQRLFPRVLVLALLLSLGGHAAAQGATKPDAAAPAGKTPGFETLKGAWVRPDGGYVIAINEVDANGQLKATYFNPGQLPFAQAAAVREGASLRLFFEIREGGYNGSTYSLTYNPATDRLQGTYYQAVAKQKFDVYFVRKP